MSSGDLLGQMFSICTTLSDEAMHRAKEKAKQSGFDVDRGLISLDESFINLSSARIVLEDAIEKRKLIQLHGTKRGPGNSRGHCQVTSGLNGRSG
jgi:hypothetical protein